MFVLMRELGWPCVRSSVWRVAPASKNACNSRISKCPLALTAALQWPRSLIESKTRPANTCSRRPGRGRVESRRDVRAAFRAGGRLRTCWMCRSQLQGCRFCGVLIATWDIPCTGSSLCMWECQCRTHDPGLIVNGNHDQHYDQHVD